MSGAETASARGRGLAVFLLGMVVVCLAFGFLAQPPADDWTRADRPVLSYLLVVLAGIGCRPHVPSLRRPGIYLLGMLAAMALLAGGLEAWLGTGAMLGASAVLVVVYAWSVRRVPRPPVEAPAPLAERAAYVLLLGAVIACAVALMVGYMPAARASAYAFADLGVAFLLGALATLALWRRAARLPGAPVAAALVIIAVALVNALSFFGYPSLLVSGSAVLQTSSYLLTPGRVFPFYVLAFALGVPAGLLWCGAAPRPEKAAVWIAPILAVLAGAVLARRTYAGPYALAVGLALAAAVATWLKGGRGSVALRVVTVTAGALGLVWLLAGEPHMEWGGLRTTLGSVLHTTGPTGQPAPAGRPVSVRLADGKWRVVLESADVRATFLDGNLVDFTRTGGTDQLAGVRACVALGLAYAPAEGKVRVEQPELASTAQTLATLAPQRPAASPDETCALIIVGPGPLTAAANPLSALNTRNLISLRVRLGPSGVLALWLPAGNLHVDELRRALATVRDVFPRCDVYLLGRSAVVIAGGHGKISYARLAGLFGREHAASGDMWAELSGPASDAAAAMLRGAGFVDPMDLLTGFAGSAEDLAGLTAGVRPYDAWRPSRPAAMALDLAEPARPAAVLALAQYRALGPERLTGRLQFDGPAQKMVALRGFDAIYADRTARTLRGLGTTSPERRAELLKFLTGPLARLDLLAPEQKEREVRIAVALAAIGLRQAGAAVLTNAIKAGHDTFEVNVELAGIQEAQAERGEALKHLRRALELRPDDASVRGHIVALLLSTGQEGEAADMLEEMVRRDPDNAAQLLELGYLYAKLKRYQDAASAAERVLRIDPGNQDAQALLSATQQVPAPQPPDASGSETPPESRRDGGAT